MQSDELLIFNTAALKQGSEEQKIETIRKASGSGAAKTEVADEISGLVPPSRIAPILGGRGGRKAGRRKEGGEEEEGGGGGRKGRRKSRRERPGRRREKDGENQKRLKQRESGEGGQWSWNLALKFFLHVVHPELLSCLWWRGHDFSHLGHRGPGFLARGTSFMEDNFLTDGGGDGFGMIQAHYMYCALYFYYYYIRSNSDHQALDLRA